MASSCSSLHSTNCVCPRCSIRLLWRTAAQSLINKTTIKHNSISGDSESSRAPKAKLAWPFSMAFGFAFGCFSVVCIQLGVATGWWWCNYCVWIGIYSGEEGVHWDLRMRHVEMVGEESEDMCSNCMAIEPFMNNTSYWLWRGMWFKMVSENDMKGGLYNNSVTH